MKNIITSLLFVILSIPSFALTLGQQADSAYNAENYPEAISLYKQSIEREGRSDDIYYNLGNAYYRADKPGMAVLNYDARCDSTLQTRMPERILSLCAVAYRTAPRTIPRSWRRYIIQLSAP